MDLECIAYANSVKDTQNGIEDPQIDSPTSPALAAQVIDSISDIYGTKFQFFPRLPIELRLEIWRLSLPEPRIVEVQWSYYRRKWFSPAESSERTSGLLHANRESQEVFLSKYQPIMERVPSRIVTGPNGSWTAKERKIAIDKSHPSAYFNPELDTLFINANSNPCYENERIRTLKGLGNIAEVQSLACAFDIFDFYSNTTNENHKALVRCLLGFPQLTQVLYIVGDRWQGKRAYPSGAIVFGKMESYYSDPNFRFLRDIINDSIAGLSKFIQDLADPGQKVEVEHKHIWRGGIDVFPA